MRLSGRTSITAIPCAAARKAALEAYGEDVLKALQLRPIAPDEVNLTPNLIKYNR